MAIRDALFQGGCVFMDEHSRPIVIQKYGGSSVATIEKLEAIADRVVRRQKDGYGVVVVVSAMGNKTDELLRLARQITPEPPARELDMLLSTGERTTMALLSIAIQKRGAQSISFTGSQSGIITTDSHSHARIISVRPYRIQDELERNKIVIVAGFQGTSYKNEITTLGRGGSDMTAIALAGALSAESCEIYSDVDGVYTADPKVVLDAQKLDELSSAEMIEMAQHGAKVLHDEAVLYAHRHQIALYAKKSHAEKSSGTLIRPDGWPDYALKAAQIHPTAIVTAKKTMFVRMNDTNTADFLDILEHCDGARVMDMVASNGGIDALLDIWNCPDEDALKARIDPAHAGCIRCDVRNVTAVGLDIGRCTDIIRKMNQAVSELGVGVIALFTQPNAVTFVVTLDDVAAVSNVLHAFITQ
ncbi:MAG: aspartate kinase [Proteobacteria bacterium]|nr:aspartate kinase [Pseudomonadota bacterium]